MTLEEFLEKLVENPFYIIAYFALIPITALIAGFLGKDEGHLAPWNYLYSTLIYLVCVPGIFAFTFIIFCLSKVESCSSTSTHKSFPSFP